MKQSQPRQHSTSEHIRRLLRACALLAVAVPVTAHAQCADGSPAPCRARVRVDTNVFIVLPFTVRGPESVQYLSESMVDLLHMALDGVGKMRIEYAPSTLRRLNEMAEPQNTRAAAGFALELGAGRVIGGLVLAIGSEVRIRAEVFDAVRGRPQFTVEGRANTDNVAAVVDSLATQILAKRLVPVTERVRLNVGEYGSKSPKALLAYLVAKQHARRGERRVAADSAKSALRHDPDFGLAHVLLHRLESAQGGVTGLPLAQITKTAHDRRARFPERVRLMFEGDGQTGERAGRIATAQANAARYPADPDFAYRLADLYFHAGMNLGQPIARVIDAFRRALAFDDQDPELLQHFQVLMEEQGDTIEGRAAYIKCHAIAPMVCADDLGFRAIYRREDPRALAVGRDSLFWGGLASYFVRATPWNPAFGLAITDSFAQIQTGPSRQSNIRRNAYLVRSNVALARGQFGLAWVFLDSAQAASLGSPGPVPGYQMLHHIVTGTHGAEAAPDRVNRESPNFLTTRLLVRAWWAAVRQPPDSAELLFKELEVRPWPDSAMGLAAAVGLRGVIALRRADTAQAIELLTRSRSNHKRTNIPERVLLPGASLALLLAQLEAARGSWTAARLYLADLYPQNDYVPFIGDVEELRGQVALALADTAAAKRHLRNVVSVWNDADPPLQPRVAAARAMLARLDGH